MAVKNYARAEQAVMDNWDPEVRPVHCSNCLHCKVFETNKGLFVRCEMGQGKCAQRSYWAVMRRQHPFALMDAKLCKEWESMDDGD